MSVSPAGVCPHAAGRLHDALLRSTPQTRGHRAATSEVRTGAIASRPAPSDTPLARPGHDHPRRGPEPAVTEPPPRSARPGHAGHVPSFRRQRLAVTALFAFVGAVFGSWAARIPDVTAQVGATHSTLGVALLCISAGALTSMQLTGLLAARFGPGRVAVAGTAALAPVVALPGLAGSIPQLSITLLGFGVLTGLVNVAVNSAGIAVEARRPGRPLLPGLHAAFSLGGLAGAAAGGVAAGLGPVFPHLAVVGAVGLAVAALARDPLSSLGRPRERTAAEPAREPASTAHRPPARRTTTTRRPGRLLVVLLGLVAGCTSFGEGAITDWGALHLQETLGAAPALAAAGYSCFSLAMACGRLACGVLLRRLGQTRLLTGGALLGAAGMTLALVTSGPEIALAGFVLVGLGLANLFPVAIARAGAQAGARGVALASSVGYTGLLGGPPAIGFLAEHAGLRAALGTVPVLALVAAALVVVVGSERRRLALPSRISPAPAALRRALTPTGRIGPAARGAMVLARTRPLRIVHTEIPLPPRPTILLGTVPRGDRSNGYSGGMPNPSIKNEKVYEKLRDEGASKEKAARIANASAAEGRKKVSARGGRAGSYDDMTRDELYERAKEIGIAGRSSMTRDELVDALRNH